MLQGKVERLLEDINDKSVDFYLEDDMFEIEGLARIDGEKVLIKVIDAVGHILEMSGDELELFFKNEKLYAKRVDNGKSFEMEINRIFQKLTDPLPEDFENLEKQHINQFFQKETDTLIWKSRENNSWWIEINKINMYCNGDRLEYVRLQELFQAHQSIIKGIWQAVYFSAEAEE